MVVVVPRIWDFQSIWIIVQILKLASQHLRYKFQQYRQVSVLFAGLPIQIFKFVTVTFTLEKGMPVGVSKAAMSLSANSRANLRA